MIAWLALAASAQSTPETAWPGSRWLVEIEETTPSPLELSAEENYSFRTRALQMQAVLACPKATPYGKLVEVECRFESVALRATPRSLEPGEALNPHNQEVLTNMVGRLVGTRVVFETSADGRITSVDLPDVQAGNRRESESRETLRRLAFDVVSSFHLKRPDDWKSGWTEKNSLLLRAPTSPASSGMSKIEHTVSNIDGATVLQSTGSGTFTAPYEPWEFGYDGKITTFGSAGTSSGKSGGVGPVSGGNFSAANDGRPVGSQPAATTPTEYTFAGTTSGVAVIDPASGLPTERVWATLGRPTASSLGNMQGLSVYYAGRLKRLGATEAAPLGSTEVVAPPGTKLEGIGVWVPLTTL